MKKLFRVIQKEQLTLQEQTHYFGKYYEAENKSSSKTTVIPVDAKKYNEGVIAAGKTFLNFHLTEFEKNFK